MRTSTPLSSGGHNGLSAAALLASGGLHRVLVLEQRPVLGGAAVSESIVPGFTFSRGSYLLSLLRPALRRELQLDSRPPPRGLRVLERPHSSTTVMADRESEPLLLPTALSSPSSSLSSRDIASYAAYTHKISLFARTIDPLLDHPPLQPLSGGGLRAAAVAAARLGPRGVQELGEMITAPASKILNRWFESEALKGTLATDAVIGAAIAPSTVRMCVCGHLQGHS